MVLGLLSRRAFWPALIAASTIALAVLVGLLTVKLGSFQHQVKALVIVIAGIAVVVAALRADYGLTILIALIPFEFGFYGTNSDQVLLYALTLVMAWRIRASAIPTWVGAGGLALVLGSFIATVGAHSHSLALEGAVNWLAAILALFVALSVLRRRREASRRMVDIFTGSAVIVVLFAFLQKSGVYAIVGAPHEGGTSSFFAYYTVYAGYVAMAATLATGEILIALERRQTGRTVVYGLALVFMLTGIAISTSRGGLVALGAGWLMLLTLNLRRGPVLAHALAILAIFLAAGYIATPRATIATIEHRIALSNGTLGGDKERFALQAAGERALGSHPFGLGYGNFSFYLSANVHNADIHQTFFHAHETPVQIGLDAGWLGLAGFLTLLAMPVVLVFARRGTGVDTVRASAFAAALGGLIAQGLYDYLFYDLAFLVFFVAMVWGTVHSLDLDAHPAAGAEHAP
jgi:O-antigen ligase/polysaccharide polymerase Wzy-like membrane protein